VSSLHGVLPAIYSTFLASQLLPHSVVTASHICRPDPLSSCGKPAARALTPTLSHRRYAANKELARRAPPDQAVWKRVLEAMQLTPEQLEALAEVRRCQQALNELSTSSSSSTQIRRLSCSCQVYVDDAAIARQWQQHHVASCR
jgi:hypothetical protein